MSSINVQVRIAETTEPRFFLQALPLFLTAENVRKETVFQIGVGVVQIIETEQVAVLVDTKIVLRSNHDTILMHSITKVTYDIGGVDLSANSVDVDHASVPVEVVQLLVATAYSTVRGIIYVRCAGSLLQKLSLPLTDPMAFLDKGRIIEGISQPAAPLTDD
jgi:hypothetical protein